MPINPSRTRLVHTSLILAAALMLPPAHAVDIQPKATGIESGNYVWNEMDDEKVRALKAKGDAQRGAIAFEGCQGCHRPGALGRINGSYPRLAGQHASVLIKQMSDIRAGRRDNDKMYPFADDHVITVQDMADIAVYLQGLPVPADNGRGPGDNLGHAQERYAADCAECHGKSGEGNADKFFPRVSGQHFQYLLRESLAIREGQRRNANPQMVKVIKSYSNEDISQVADYMSRFALK